MFYKFWNNFEFLIFGLNDLFWNIQVIYFFSLSTTIDFLKNLWRILVEAISLIYFNFLFRLLILAFQNFWILIAEIFFLSNNFLSAIIFFFLSLFSSSFCFFSLFTASSFAFSLIVFSVDLWKIFFLVGSFCAGRLFVYLFWPTVFLIVEEGAFREDLFTWS